MAWFDKFFFVLSKKVIQFEAKQFSFIFLVQFILPKNYFWSFRFPERLRDWSANQYVLRAWVRIPFLSISFKNTWIEFGEHKNWYLPNFVNNSPKNLSDHKELNKKLARKPLMFV